MRTIAMRIYRRLALAFPHEFQMLYGADIIELGEEAIDGIWAQHGVFGLIRLLADIAVRLPIEYLSEMRQDVAYAVRTLSNSRGFLAVGVISLGLGIGITAVSASEFLNLIFRDAPGVKDPDRLVLLGNPDSDGATGGSSYPYFERYRMNTALFTGVAAYLGPAPFNIALNAARRDSSAKPERIFGHVVSPEYFSVIGARAARGRTFDPRIDKPGSPPVVFVSDRFWREHMGADANAVGRAIRVNGQTATIVGIGQKDFFGIVPILPADIFVPATSPVTMVPDLAGDVIHKADAKPFNILLRLAPGVGLKSAEAGLDAVKRNLDQEWHAPERNIKARRVTLLPGGKMIPLQRELLPGLMLMAILVDGLILAIACMNLANMQLARATARRREVAIRLSVGASRFRLLRQMLTESVLLAAAGGVAGIVFAYWAADGLKKLRMPFPFPVNFDITPDWRALLFASAVSLAAGIAFGLAPALANMRTELASTLKQGALTQMRGFRRFGIRNLLMGTQVAGSLMLLLIAGFLIIGFHTSNLIDVPFDPLKMFLISLDPVRDGYSVERASDLFETLPERLQRASGAESVVVAEAPPFSPLIGNSTVTAPSAPGMPDQVATGIARQAIGAGYFASLSVHVLAGREFDSRDQRMDAEKGKALPVIVNESAARACFGSRDPLGRRVMDMSRSYSIVGVVKDLAAPMSPTGAGAGTTSYVPTMYLPLNRSDVARPSAGGVVVMVRAARGADAMERVRREIGAIDPNLVMFNVRTLAEQLNVNTFALRLDTFIYSGIGVFGLVLAAIGLAGVTAYSVARRKKELGIRMALGARRSQVLRLVMREGGVLVIAGSTLGFLGALAASRALASASSMLGPAFEAGARDLRLTIGAPLLLAGLAMLACYVPARRSANIDPLIVLREE